MANEFVVEFLMDSLLDGGSHMEVFPWLALVGHQKVCDHQDKFDEDQS